MYSESCKHGSEGGLCKPTAERRQGGTFLPYNFIVALAFSQMFNLLCERADNVFGGRLPHHVRILWDEAANTGQVPSLEKLVAVVRSREVSLCLLYQQLSQCKAIYKDNSETILGNMDSVVFLGGRESSTIKEISENWLGKATISMQTEGRRVVSQILCKHRRAVQIEQKLFTRGGGLTATPCFQYRQRNMRMSRAAAE